MWIARCWAARFKGVEVRCVELSDLCVVCVWFGAAAGVVVRRMSDNTVSCVTELSSVVCGLTRGGRLGWFG